MIGGPYNKDPRILGSILGFPYFGIVPQTLAFLVVPLLRIKGARNVFVGGSYREILQIW